MIRFLILRVLQMLAVLLGVVTILFFLLRLSGDPLAMLVPPDTPSDQLAALRQELGFNDPLWTQYVRFLRSAVVLDFGRSIELQRPALRLVLQRLPATVELTFAAFIAAFVVGVPVGMAAVFNRGPLFTAAITSAAVLGQGIPLFWLGLLLIGLFGVGLRWLPTFGMGGLNHLILPALTLSGPLMAKTMRLVRSSMMETLNQQHIVTAYAKGLPVPVVIWRHAFRNGLIPIVTALSIDLGLLLGGAILVEQVFAWPGIGRQLTHAVLGRDYPLIEASVFIIAVLFLLINLGVDLSYRFLDPRINVATS